MPTKTPFSRYFLILFSDMQFSGRSKNCRWWFPRGILQISRWPFTIPSCRLSPPLPTTRPSSFGISPTGKLINTFSGHFGIVNCIRFSPNGRILAAASDTLIYLWNVMNGQLMSKYSTTCKPVTNFFFSSASDIFVYQQSPNSFSVQSLNADRKGSKRIVPGTLISSCIFGTSNNELFVVVDKTKIYRLDIFKGTIDQLIVPNNKEVLRIIRSPGALNTNLTQAEKSTVGTMNYNKSINSIWDLIPTRLAVTATGR